MPPARKTPFRRPTRDAVFAAAATLFCQARLRRRHRRRHRPRRRREQGDDLLPLRRQARALPRSRPRQAARDGRDRQRPSPTRPARPPTSSKAFIAAFVRMTETRPWFPTLMLREIAEGAPHLDVDTLALMRDRDRGLRRASSPKARTRGVVPARQPGARLHVGGRSDDVQRRARAGRRAARPQEPDLPMFVAVSHDDVIAHGSCPANAAPPKAQHQRQNPHKRSDLCRSSLTRRRLHAKQPPTERLRVSGHVEATEVRLAPDAGGRILELPVKEGDRVAAGPDRPDARRARRPARDRAREGGPGAGRSAAAARAGRRARRDIRQAQRRSRPRARRSPLREPSSPPPSRTSSASKRCSRTTPARASSGTMRRRGGTWRANV